MKRPLRILMTAGPTHEYMDPVRYLTNPSSGQMGLAIATALQKSRFNVTLVSGPIKLKIPSRIKHVSVVSAKQMASVVKKNLAKTDVFISTAAVSDYRFSSVKKNKIKKGRSIFSVRLIKNPDILADAGQTKRKNKNLRLVGFALETKNVAKEAARKLKKKKLDLIIGNGPSSFSTQRIRPYWLEKNSKGTWLKAMTKTQLAQKMVQWIKVTSKNR